MTRGRIVLACLLSCSMTASAAMLPQQRDPRVTVAPPATGTGSISGVVTDRQQMPLATAIVRIAIEGVPTKRETVTDAAGRFGFGNLPPGRIQISAHKAGYLDEWSGQSANATANGLLILGQGQAIADVTIAMTRGGAISGIVTGETGEPIRANVRLTPRDRSAQEMLGGGVQASVPTDARGRYRIGSLPPGEYVVAALSLEPSDARTLGPDGRDREFSFVATYFPAALQPQDATPVRVNEGDVSGINIQIVSTPAGTAEGQLTHVSGLPVTGQQVTFVGRNRQSFSAMPIDGGRFRIGGVPYGEYEVFASGAVRPESASMQVGWARATAIFGPDRLNLALSLTPGGAMRGRVSIEDGASMAGIKVRVFPFGFAASSVSGPNLFIATVADDGAFAFANLAPGRYVISLEMPAKTPWSVERIEIGGQRVQDWAVEIAGGFSLDGVHIAMIDTRAEISGTVTASDGSPLSGVLVAAFPERPVPSGRYPSAITDAAGRYVLASVPLGRLRIEVVGLSPSPVIHTGAGPRPEPTIVVIDARGQKKVVDFRR